MLLALAISRPIPAEISREKELAIRLVRIEMLRMGTHPLRGRHRTKQELEEVQEANEGVKNKEREWGGPVRVFSWQVHRARGGSGWREVDAPVGLRSGYTRGRTMGYGDCD